MTADQKVSKRLKNLTGSENVEKRTNVDISLFNLKKSILCEKFCLKISENSDFYVNMLINKINYPSLF